MAFEVIATNPGVSYEVDTTDIVILPSGVLYTSTGDGLDATADVTFGLNGVTLQIHGQIYANGRAIDFWGSLGGSNAYNNNTIFVGSTGVVSGTSQGFIGESGSNNQIQNYGQISGATAIETYGGANSLILNGGLISGISEYGIRVFGEVDTASAPNTVITNLAGGTISGQIAAIGLQDLVGSSSITNYGMITSSLGIGIDLASVTAGQSAISIANWGTIQGPAQAIRGSANGDILVNKGLVYGDVQLGDGADRFDTRTGTLDGDFDGGAGNDTVLGNAAQDEVFAGGVGIDTLGFRGGAVTVALDGSLDAGGAALGDSYSGFENVNGSAFADRIIGSSVANRLTGGGGVDTISGGAGADVIFGNRGADVLTGGAGDDQFLFNAIADGGDKISDFGTGVGNNDVLRIDASNFGGGLVAGALVAAKFASRADNLAQDADDRFILRSTDKTLWFDADGNGAGAAVLVADLQNTAVFNRLDILLF